MSGQNYIHSNSNMVLENNGPAESKKRGKLKIFFSYAPGAGKTYEMLIEAKKQLKRGIDVIVGYVDPHTSTETMELLNGLPVLPPVNLQYKNIRYKELDLNAALKRNPQLILVDELAHSNADGMRNKKRYQDIEELLNAGIDVYTTVNVQQIESLSDVSQNTGEDNRVETIPDYIFDNAEEIKLIDIEPDELLQRLWGGKIFSKDISETAENKFFKNENLRLLREAAMRKAADSISHNVKNGRYISQKIANTRFLVCSGNSPSSAKCIRWTARTANAFHAPWTAVYVEDIDSQYFTETEKKNVRANLDLAEKLGAETVTLNGKDAAYAIAEYAKLSGITNIVIGKSRNRKSVKSLFETDIEDKLISLLPDIEIHIVSDCPSKKPYKKPRMIRLRQNLYLSWSDTLKAIGLLTGATLLSMTLRTLETGSLNIIMVYILSILIVSRITMGYIYGIAASILSVLSFNFFFTIPYFTFNAIQPDYPITFIIMLLVALITSALTVRIRTQARFAVEREHRAEVLYEISSKLLVTRGVENIVPLVNEYIVKLFNRSVIFYTEKPGKNSEGTFIKPSLDEDASFFQLKDERAAVKWVFVNQKCDGAGTDTFTGACAFYMPVISHGHILGVIGLSCAKSKLEHDSRLFLQMITSQVAMALERQYLSDKQRQILLESEKEKMRSNLLRAISHDLRTPLTCILGASSVILENGDKMDKNTHDQLLSNIKEDSQWLIRMVENLLSVTRINEGTMNVAKTPEAAEEVVAEAISRIRKMYPSRKISVKVPDELLMVPMDGTLIEQVLINLIENAIKHCDEDSKINVLVKKGRDNAIFQVIDDGRGIAEKDFPYLFESYVPDGSRSPDSTRGMGIGLSICMSIIKAHHGKMEAANRKEGGAIFQFMLPLEEVKDSGQ